MIALQTALEYEKYGWSVIPLTSVDPQGRCSCSAGAKCETAGQHPRVSWKEYQKRRATPDEIRNWWKRWPKANIGIVTGVISGIIVLDVDAPAGEETIKRGNLHLPPTAISRTGGGGWHHFYQHPGFPCRNFAGKIGKTILPNIDFKGDGGLIVVPPSAHRNGNSYEWATSPSIATLVAAPEWVLLLIKAQSGGNANKVTPDEWENDIPEGERNTTLARLAGSLFSKGNIPPKEVLVLVHAMNTRKCQPPLEHDEVVTLVRSIWKTHMRKGKGDRVENESLDDIGNAQRLAKRHGHNLRRCKLWKGWHVWDNRRWASDDLDQVVEMAKDTAIAVWKEVADGVDSEERKAIAKHATNSNTNKGLSAMIKLARSIPQIASRSSDFDQDIWLFNVANGTIDLRTGSLREHRREDMITNLSHVEYNPEARCERWLQFLDEIMEGNQNLIDFLQRGIGLSLTGDVSEHVLFILHGKGRNGKTTLLSTVLAALGDYGAPAPPDLLIARQGDRHPTELADLFGKRAVISVENEEGKRLAESLVKSLTGGDKIKARRMREDFWEFAPTHKLWMSTNHKPHVRGTDVAIWSRLKLIPFNATYPDDDPRQDKNLPEKLLAELPGILSWAVQGCLQWQQVGLGIPDEVRMATNIYREQEDPLNEFLTDCCLVDPAVRAHNTYIWTAYLSWAKDIGEKYTLGRKRFTQELIQRGFVQRRMGQERYWQGIALIAGYDKKMPEQEMQK